MDDMDVAWVGCTWVAGHPVEVLCDAVSWRLIVRSRWTGRDLGTGESFAAAEEEAARTVAAGRPVARLHGPQRMRLVSVEEPLRRRPVREWWRRLKAIRTQARGASQGARAR